MALTRAKFTIKHTYMTVEKSSVLVTDREELVGNQCHCEHFSQTGQAISPTEKWSMVGCEAQDHVHTGI